MRKYIAPILLTVTLAISATMAWGQAKDALYKSLGGGWQNYQAVPAIRRPQPAIIAAFRRALSSSAP